MSESTLSINYDDLLIEVGGFLGYGVSPTGWSDGQKAEMDRYVQSGLRQFYYPPALPNISAGYEWSFLIPRATIDIVESVSTYDLPDDFSRVSGEFHYDKTMNRAPIIIVSIGQMQSLMARNTGNSFPKFASVNSKESDGATGQRYEVVLWPIPSESFTLDYRYEAYSGKLTTDKKYPLGGMKHSELIIESCLAVAEQRANDERGTHTNRFSELLVSSIELDRKAGARFYGQMGENYESNNGRQRRNFGTSYPVTYKGETW